MDRDAPTYLETDGRIKLSGGHAYTFRHLLRRRADKSHSMRDRERQAESLDSYAFQHAEILGLR